MGASSQASRDLKPGVKGSQARPQRPGQARQGLRGLKLGLRGLKPDLRGLNSDLRGLNPDLRGLKPGLGGL